MKNEIKPDAFIPLIAFLAFMMLVCIIMLVATTINYIIHLF